MAINKLRKKTGSTDVPIAGQGEWAGVEVINRAIQYNEDGTNVKRVPSSVCDTTNAASGTTQNTEYTLNSVTLPANTFDKAGKGVTVAGWAQLAANANAKNLKIYFGATAVATVTGSTANAKDVYYELCVVRTGASAQSAVGYIQVDTGQAGTMAINASLTESETAAIVIAFKSANTAAAAASATGKGMIVTVTE